MCKLVVEIRSSGLEIYQQIFQNADEVVFLTNSNDVVPLETTISKKQACNIYIVYASGSTGRNSNQQDNAKSALNDPRAKTVHKSAR